MKRLTKLLTLFLVITISENNLLLTSTNASNLTVPASREIEFDDNENITTFVSEILPGSETNIAPDVPTETVESLAHILDIYNSEGLIKNWDNFKSKLTPLCRVNIGEYIRGLKQKASWALKMEDSTGRYNTGWFWGNNYWTGSKTLCDNIAGEKMTIIPSTRQAVSSENTTSSSMDHNRLKRNALAKPKLAITQSPGGALGYRPGPLEQETDLPFPLAFYVLNLEVNLSTALWTAGSRTVHIGVCLPRACSDTDVKILFQDVAEAKETSEDDINNVRILVNYVKSHNQYYNMWDDITFRILCGSTIALTILLIAGTSYDLYLQDLKERKRLKQHQFNCTTYDLTNPKHVKLDINIPEAKIRNGKSAMYVVNNNVQSPEEVSSENENEGNPDVTKILSDMLLSFSIRINWNQICDSGVGSDTISAIHGLRSISMAWVILGHTCIIAFKYSDNMDFRKLVEKEFLFQTITNGAFSVDTFFFISGLLVTFIYFRTNAKGKLEPLTQGSKGFTAGCLHFVGLLGYRFTRLTAPYLYVLGVVEVSMKWFQHNSVFEPPTMDHENCPNYWWRNVLYINTLFPMEQMCMLWSWYLSDDTQFYVVGAIILILAHSHFKTAVGVLAVLLISSWTTTGYIAYINSHAPASDDPLALFDKIYDKPWTRLGPYVVGMIVGWILFKTNCQLRMSKLTVLVGWLGSIAVLLSLVYGLYETHLSAVAGAAYSSLSHTAWAIGLAWIVVACSTGHGGYVNKLLSAPVLYPFSRVTYCAYLVHPIILRGVTMSIDSPLHLGKATMAVMFLGQVVASYVLSFIISLAVEAPVVTMLKILTQFKQRRLSKPGSYIKEDGKETTTAC